ncbi:hypothetical protein [Pontimicrobium aquaticum]|uniref:Uncharacterized protein n=1 Tax=Pontimicrobium aquaticum TaxID=2565367 RepID=A0A4U0EQH7_9FLAO|nr:hypothetical protein [Pontimicrobium aquaticum]TJY33384.1 hypothetical protein E5167_12855 [Pontimicrobium aquaticum]
MGLFGNLFKKKKGGTFFGNLLRGVSSAATGGILGSGAGLAKWEAEQNQKEYDAAVKKQAQEMLKNNPAYNAGRNLGEPYAGAINQAVNNSEAAKELQNQQVKAWFKRNWYYLVGAIVVIGGIWWYMKKGGKKVY